MASHVECPLHGNVLTRTCTATSTATSTATLHASLTLHNVESTSPDEARQFFREHSTTVFGALYDGFLRLLGKIQGKRLRCAVPS